MDASVVFDFRRDRAKIPKNGMWSEINTIGHHSVLRWHRGTKVETKPFALLMRVAERSPPWLALPFIETFRNSRRIRQRLGNSLRQLDRQVEDQYR
jgi:hypothetical protein